jgi:hypothetical protein
MRARCLRGHDTRHGQDVLREALPAVSPVVNGKRRERDHGSNRGRIRSALGLLALSVSVCSCPTHCNAAEPIVAELTIGTDYVGEARELKFDTSEDALFSTTKELYRVQGGRLHLIDKVDPRNNERFAVVSGDGAYGRLVQSGVPPGLFVVDLVDPLVPLRAPVRLRLGNYPHGFSNLYLSTGAGPLIVTSTPLDDAEALRGRFQYTFWARDGTQRADVTRNGRRNGIVDVEGYAILLLGEQDAIAFNEAGTEIWQRTGRFGRGALAGRGRIALLNPVALDQTKQIDVVRGSATTTIHMDDAVRALALTADGLMAAVAVDKAKVTLLDVQSCRHGRCAKPKPVNLQLPRGQFFITALQFVDATTLAVGVIERQGNAPPFRYPRAMVLAVDTDARVSFYQRELLLAQPATWTPEINATFGVRKFAAHTPQKTLLIELQ